jgi:hypothetical protein
MFISIKKKNDLFYAISEHAIGVGYTTKYAIQNCIILNHYILKNKLNTSFKKEEQSHDGIGKSSISQHVGTSKAP